MENCMSGLVDNDIPITTIDKLHEYNDKSVTIRGLGL